MKNTIFFLIISLYTYGSFAQKQYKQQDLDTITFSHLLNIKSKGELLKEMLDSDASLIGYAKYYTYLSYLQMLKRNYDSTKYFANKAIDVYNNREFEKELGERFIYKAYYIKGLREYFDDKILTSAKTLYKALELSSKHREVGFEDWRFYILGRLVTIHSKKLGDYTLAIKYQKEIVKDSLHVSYAYDGGNAFSKLGVLYSYNHNQDSAKLYFKKAIQRFNFGTKDGYTLKPAFLTSKSLAYANLANTYKNLQQIDSAIYYVKIKQEILKRIKGEKLFYKAYNNIYYNRDEAFLLLQDNKPDKAIHILRSNLDSLQKDQSSDRAFKELKTDLYDLLAEAYEQKKNYKEAISILKNKNDFINKFDENKRAYQLQQLNTEYELREKESQIEVAELKSLDQENSLVLKNTYIFGLIGLLIILIITSLLFSKQRKLQNKYNQIILNQRLLRSQMNPHFVFNALNTTAVLVTKESRHTLPYIHKLSSLFRSMLETSREEFISMNDEVKMVTDYLDLESNFSENFNYSLKIQNDIEVDEIFIPPMFIQPFVENSIKHGVSSIEKKGEVELDFSLLKKEKLLRCIICDNGIGLKENENEIHKSMSSAIIKERLEIFKKKFKVETRYEIYEKDNKTIVELFLPYVED